MNHEPIRQSPARVLQSDDVRPGVLAALRALTPRRPLLFREAVRVADLQADRLLTLSGIDRPPVPSSVITDLPRVEVACQPSRWASGATAWVGDRWLILLAADEASSFRSRFSLAHEFKHVIDHPVRSVVYVDRPGFPAEDQAERAAHAFAAALLMPKRLVVRAWAGGLQNVYGLAARFEVSPSAMEVRLRRLGLLESPSQKERAS